MAEKIKTKILPVDAGKIGSLTAVAKPDDILDDFAIDVDADSEDGKRLLLAASQLRSSSLPVAFPTETVYGLGADATRSEAVRGIYRAKQRPADNPLIVHFASLAQLRRLLGSSSTNGVSSGTSSHDSIPRIYHTLISRFWPGPLTILLPNPKDSPLAPEVTAGLTTFGARIPRHELALALIKLSDVPIAAPSANASTKPSPTAAEHVAHDLSGRIEYILDGGLCDVGVESTVVDGLSQPPLVLRPGGISLEQLHSCPGWEETQIGYKNSAEIEERPKAPGMKYRHYSPNAPVVLYEVGREAPRVEEVAQWVAGFKRIGFITTKSWCIDASNERLVVQSESLPRSTNGVAASGTGFAGLFNAKSATLDLRAAMKRHVVQRDGENWAIFQIALGAETANIARGIFSGLRELDRADVDAIIVEGIDETEGDTAAAVMNRLRKAAEVNVHR